MAISSDVRRQLTPLEPAVAQLESAEALDAPAKAIGEAVRNKIGSGTLKSALSGTWLGHAVHPMLTDVVIGSFTSASLLDVVGSNGDAASQRLIGLGLLAYLPTAASGINDWADTEVIDDGVRRVGLVHASCNAIGASLYALSWGARRRGARRLGTAFGLAGMAVIAAGGYLGGHLSMTKGVGPAETVFDQGPTEWTPAVDASALRSGQPQRVVVDDTPVLLLHQGEEILAIHDRCSHRGCSLSEGSIEGEEIVCPCHGSRFSLRTGAVKHGPATASQPAFQVRTKEGRVEVRRVAPR